MAIAVTMISESTICDQSMTQSNPVFNPYGAVCVLVLPTKQNKNHNSLTTIPVLHDIVFFCIFIH